VVVDEEHVAGMTEAPPEADAPLVVHADGVEPLQCAVQCLGAGNTFTSRNFRTLCGLVAVHDYNFDVLDTAPETLRMQAQLMQQLAPEQRLRRVFAWSADLLQASRAAWLRGDEAGAAPEHDRLQAWLHAQHGHAITPGFVSAHAAWLRRQVAMTGAR
jgi:hypothetical protein